MTGGSAAPPLLIDAFRDEYGVTVEHGWGMTELSPVGTYNAEARSGRTDWRGGDAAHAEARPHPGRDRYEDRPDADNKELPWDGKAFGDLKVRGPWIASAYYGDEAGSALDEAGWFATGDVATIVRMDSWRSPTVRKT